METDEVPTTTQSSFRFQAGAHCRACCNSSPAVCTTKTERRKQNVSDGCRLREANHKTCCSSFKRPIDRGTAENSRLSCKSSTLWRNNDTNSGCEENQWQVAKHSTGTDVSLCNRPRLGLKCPRKLFAPSRICVPRTSQTNAKGSNGEGCSQPLKHGSVDTACHTCM